MRSIQSATRPFRRWQAVLFASLSLGSAAYSGMVQKKGDIVFHRTPVSYRWKEIHFDYLFRGKLVIPMYKGDSLFAISDTLRLSKQIKMDWELYKGRHVSMIENMSDGSGFQFSSNRDTIRFDHGILNNECSPETAEAVNRMVEKIEKIDKDFRLGAGKRILDSLFQVQTQSQQEKDK